MKRFHTLLLLLLVLLAAFGLKARAQHMQPAPETKSNLIQAALKGWHVRVGAGLALGGTAPMPLPAEIRKINSYNPTLCIYIEGDAEKKLTEHWGMMVGMRFENRGMKTDARVKNYHVDVVSSDGRGHMVGAWTGNVKTEVDNRYFTFPILATYSFNDRWMVKAGPYLSWMMSGSFTGSVYDGYIRDQDPTGAKAEIESASYDFSDDLRRFAWGIQLGGEFKAYKHLSVSANLTWGCNSIFPSDFSAVTFKLFPIYGTLGFNYLF